MDKIAILHQLDKRPTNSLSDRPPTQKGLKKKTFGDDVPCNLH